MKTKILIISTCVVISFCSLFANPLDGENLPLLNIKNKELIALLDKIIIYEKDCQYYNDSISFEIVINKIEKSNNNYSIRIESFNDSTIISQRPYIGYFIFKNHLFVIIGTSIDHFFKQTTNLKYFYYWKHNPKSTIIIDDSHSVFQCYYIDNKLFIDRIFGCVDKSKNNTKLITE